MEQISEIIKHNPAVLGAKTGKEFIQAIKEEILFAPVLKTMQKIAHCTKFDFGQDMTKLLSPTDPNELFDILKNLERWSTMLDTIHEKTNEIIDKENLDIDKKNELIKEHNEQIDKDNAEINEKNKSKKFLDIKANFLFKDIPQKPRIPLVARKEKLPLTDTDIAEIVKQKKEIKARLGIFRDILSNEILSIHDAMKDLPERLVHPDLLEEPTLDVYNNYEEALNNFGISFTITRAFLKCLEILDKYAKKYKEESTSSIINDFIDHIKKEVSTQFDPNDYMASIKLLLDLIKFMKSMCPETEKIFEEIKDLEEMEFFKGLGKSDMPKSLQEQKYVVADIIALEGSAREAFEVRI